MFIILFSIILMNKSCNESEIDQRNIALEYAFSSRNAYKKIVLNKKTTTITNKKGGLQISESSKENNWKKLIDMLNDLDIENMPNLEAPSKTFQFDGAPLARLKIFYNKKVYASVPFDHGNPPDEIAPLVKEILSIAQNIE